MEAVLLIQSSLYREFDESLHFTFHHWHFASRGAPSSPQIRKLCSFIVFRQLDAGNH